LESDKAPGYFGGRRDKVIAGWNEQYGEGNWSLGWVVGDNLISYEGACKLYEDAYVEYFRSRMDLANFIISAASDVYDDSPSNVGSRLDYNIQETERTHIQDIAIRNSLLRLGLAFRGVEPVQIRGAGDHPISSALSPGQVPFHLPQLITKPSNYGEIVKKRWWLPGSVEDFYQMNKRLVIRS
jgi:hypothetical protein